MRRKPKEEFVQKSAVLPDNEPAVLDPGGVYVHPVLGPVRCTQLITTRKGVNSVPSSILLQLYPDAGSAPKEITMPQIEVKGSRIRHPATAKDITEAFARLSRADGHPLPEGVRASEMLMSNDPGTLAELVCRTLGHDPMMSGPDRKMTDMEKMMGERALGLLSRECALVMDYDLGAAEAMVKNSLEVSFQKRMRGREQHLQI